jgi:hypothetical protein
MMLLGQPTVVWCDDGALQKVQDCIASVGAEARRLDEPAELPTAGVAVVRLEPPAFDLIHALKARGFIVFACAGGASAWSLGEKCRVLLAGAARLLDSDGARFRDELVHALAEALERQTQRHDTQEQLRRVMAEQGIVGECPSMRALFAWTQRVSALSDVPVSIFGETGTGKELLARAIQQLDPKRRAGPFVALNCGAISPALAEGELFGHRRGAFTGADRDRKGLIRAAHGAVLLLDEIGELELTLQTRLLRVLQEQRVLAVGEDREVPVDVRVIAVTHRDLRAIVDRPTPAGWAADRSDGGRIC